MSAPLVYASVPEAKIEYSVEHDDDGIMYFRIHQDVDAVLELNRRRYNDAPRRWGEWTLIGTIPMVEVEVLKKTGQFMDGKSLLKYLNDADHSKFRTRPGWLL